MTNEPGDWTRTAPLEARRLLRAAASVTLATVDQGQPFASLATHAVAPDGALLLLLSDLSEHTRHLRRDGRCSVLALGSPDGPNPQTMARVTLTGRAALYPDDAARTRWVSRHPYAAFYAGFGDFNLWRLEPEAGLLVAGFGRAARLRACDLLPDPAVAVVLAPDLDDLLARWNRQHGCDGRRLVSVDADGADFLCDGTLQRVEFELPLTDAAGAEAALPTR